ncbi:hypothetical protein BC936DRAFT_142897 [Jimgerdemannia flammicorona]|uniref:Uncharacterized protein n=1 Tax=Jimgerdemannia flammicorona TaxID=994334 RepID=A0A432ZZM6_9FUNG|nr:hypothetical protein BC936DRAFT_142897 [Jimgerdemannia flammicorona]
MLLQAGEPRVPGEIVAMNIYFCLYLINFASYDCHGSKKEQFTYLNVYGFLYTCHDLVPVHLHCGGISSDGYVYIMESKTMKVSEGLYSFILGMLFCHLTMNHLHVAHGHQVTKLLKIDGDGGGNDATDYLLCTGHFNGVHMYKDGELVTIIETED